MTPQQAATAPTDELRDWCAGDDGWEPYTASNDFTVWHRGEVTVNYEVSPHPYPPTLDGAAKAMPEGWEWWRLLGFREWYAAKLDANGRITGWGVTIPDTGDEIADRYRLAVLCRIAAKEAKG